MSGDAVVLVGMAAALEGAEDLDRLWAALMDGVVLDGRAVPGADPGSAALADAGLGTDANVVRCAEGDLIDALEHLTQGTTEALLVEPRGGGIALVFEPARQAAARGARPWARVALVADPADVGGAYAARKIEPHALGLLDVTGGAGSLAPLFVAHTSPRIAVGGGGPATAHLAPALPIIRAALAVSHKSIPPADDDVSPPSTALTFLNAEPRPWVHDPARGPRRAAVHVAQRTDGVHLVLEEIDADGVFTPRAIRTGITWPSELFVFAADDRDTLLCRVADARRDAGAATGPEALPSMARRCEAACEPGTSHRLAVVAEDVEDLVRKLTLCQERLGSEDPTFLARDDIFFTDDGNRDPGRVACLFPGLAIPGLQGTYAENLLQLALRFPAVRSALDLADRRDGHPDDPVPTNELLFPPSSLPEGLRTRFRSRWGIPTLDHISQHTRVDESNLCHFGVTVANMAGWALLQQLDVPVDLFFGQSEGDLSALAAAGALTFEEILIGHASHRLDPSHFPFNCQLAIVNSSEDDLDDVVAEFPAITVAMYVTPRLQLVGGEPEEIAAFVGALRKRKISAQSLPYPAVHTDAFSEILALVTEVVGGFDIRPPRLPVYSGITASPHPADVDKIRANLVSNIDRPVRLWQTLRAMCDDGAGVFLQIGDGGSMLHRYAVQAAPRDVVGASMDLDYRDPITQVQAFCATLWTSGVGVDRGALHAHRAEPRAADVTPENGPPFLGRVIHRDGDTRIEMERVLDLDEDRFLGDHVYIRSGGHKPDSACLPILPLMFSLELMAEVASELAPDRGLIGFEAIRAARWIELRDTSTLRLRVTAETLAGGASEPRRVRVHVYLPDEDEPAVEGLVLLDVAYRADVDLRLSPLEDPTPHALDAEQIYEDGVLWHGPMLQALVGRPTLASEAALAELRVLPTSGLFRSTTDPELLIDPVVLDAVGQVLGLWCLERDAYPFPIGIEKLELYRSTPSAGTSVPVHVEIKHRDARFVVADAEVQDGEGHVWMRVQGLRDWMFRWPPHNHAVRRQPQHHLLGRVTRPTSGGTAVGVEVTAADLFDTNLDRMARIYLRLDEMDRFHAFASDADRQRTWLLGRIAAKDAVRAFTAAATDGSVAMAHPASFSIEADPNGAPIVRGLTDPAPHVSIAHCGDHAVAFADDHEVGVDLEHVAERGTGFLELVTTPAERERLARDLGGLGAMEITRAWCAKEAAGKALGVGASDAPRELEIVRAADEGRWVVEHGPSGRRLEVETRADGDLVYAIASPRRIPETA